MEEVKIDKVVKDLIADHERRDGYLTKAHVERLLAKRQLSVEESAAVYRQLDTLGISVEEEPEDPDTNSIRGEGVSESIAFEVDDDHERLDLRLRGMSTRLLTADEEVELGRRMELGRRAQSELDNGVPPSEEHAKMIESGRHAKEAMVKANLRLVLYVARPYTTLSDLSLDDLFQDGTIGLMHAADKYDHTLGYKFSTYATWWIRQSITRALMNRGATIRLPVHVFADVLRFKRAQKLLYQIHPDRSASMAELADELAWTLDKVHFIQQVGSFVSASLDERIDNYGDLTLLDTLISDLPSPEEKLGQSDLAKQIDEAMGDLTDRQRKVLQLRFGLSDQGDGLTLEEIGQMFDLTRERIRQIEAKALERLRHPNRSEILREFLK